MKLLIVVDYQNDFVDGALGFAGAEKLDEIIAQKIKEYHKNNDEVIFTLDTHYKDYSESLEGKYLPVPHCIKDTEGHKLYGKTANSIGKNDMVFEKLTFPSLELAEYLKDKAYECVEIVGLVSNICVLSNAIMVKSALPDTEIIVDANYTDSFDRSLHNKCLDIMEGLHIKVIR